MWVKTIKLCAVFVCVSLLLGGCEWFRTYIYNSELTQDTEEVAALDEDQAEDLSAAPKDRKTAPPPAPAKPKPKKIVSPGVTVAPIQGAPVLSGRQMSASVANELAARNVRASHRSQGKISYLLEGKAYLSDARGGRSDFRIDWNLIAPDGMSAGKFSDRVPIKGSGWSAVTPEVLKPMSRRAAAQVDVMLKQHVRAPARAPVDAVASKELTEGLQEIHVVRLLAAVFVGLVDGAPGDGRISLKNALSDALLRARVPVVAAYDENAFMVLGDVRVTPLDPTRNRFDITWIVTRSDGETIGSASSTMTVGVNRVIPAWGTVATTAVESVVGEIVALIDKAMPDDPPTEADS